MHENEAIERAKNILKNSKYNNLSAHSKTTLELFKLLELQCEAFDYSYHKSIAETLQDVIFHNLLYSPIEQQLQIFEIIVEKDLNKLNQPSEADIEGKKIFDSMLTRHNEKLKKDLEDFEDDLEDDDL